MSDKDINIHVRAKDTEQTKQQIDSVNQSVKKTGQETDRAGESAKKNAGLFGGLLSKLTAFASGAASIHLVTQAIRDQTQALEENAQAALKQQNALLRLQFLGDYYQQKPELRAEIMALSEFGRRPAEEVAGAAYNLRSKNAAMTEPQRMGILKEALEMGRTDPSLPLDSLVDMFSLYAKQSGVTDANRIQNVLQKTIEEAGGSGADVAGYMPRFLPVGIAGGLTPAESAGLWAYATTQEKEASIATTGLRAIMMGLQGKGTPEGAKLLQKYGVTQDMDFFTKIQTLSRAGIDLAAAEQLFQREGAAMGLAMLRDPAAMMQTIQSVTGADRGDVDLTRGKIEGLFGADEMARLEEDTRLLEIQIQNIRASDVQTVANRTRRLEIEKTLRQQGRAEAYIKAKMKEMQLMEAFGFSQQTAEEWAFWDYERPASRQEPAPMNINYNYDNSKTIMTKEPPATTRPGDL